MDSPSRSQTAAAAPFPRPPFAHPHQSPHHLLYHPGFLGWPPHHASRSIAASSAPFHALPSVSASAQRLLPAAASLDHSESTHYVNHEPLHSIHSAHSPWPANYLRPGWNSTPIDEPHTSSSVSHSGPYGPSVHPASAVPGRRIADDGATLLHSPPENSYAPTNSSHEPAIPCVPQASHETAFSASIPSALYPDNSSNVPPHVKPEPLALPPTQMPALPTTWPGVTTSELTGAQQSAIYTSQPTIGGMAAGGINHHNSGLASSSWSLINNPTSAPPPLIPFDPAANVGAEWLVTVESTGTQVPLRPPFVLPESSVSVELQMQPVGPSGRIEKRRSMSKPKLPKIASAFTPRAPKTKLSRRQGKMSEEGRAKAAQMRKIGPCVRCKLYKLGCDEASPCRRCEEVMANPRSYRELCCRVNIEQISLVRHCNGRFNQSDVYFLSYHWKEDGNGPHVMDIMWNLPGYGPMVNNQAIQVGCREYHPENTPVIDSTCNYWQTNGGTVMVVQPPYAVYDTSALITAVERYLFRSQPSIEQWIFNHIQSNQLAILTYREALRQRDEFDSTLLDLALQMQCGAILSQGYGTVWSSPAPGIKEYDFRLFGHSGYEAYDRNGRDRPLPTAIGHQMDVAILKHINSLQKRILKLLNKRFFSPGIKPWYELFLVLFIILFNLEYIHGSAERYINVKRNTRLEEQVSYIVRSQLEEWEFGASALLQVYRGILRDFKPFRLARDNLEELRTQAKLDPVAVQYASNVAALLEEENWYTPTASSGVNTEWDSRPRKWIPQLFKDLFG